MRLKRGHMYDESSKTSWLSTWQNAAFSGSQPKCSNFLPVSLALDIQALIEWLSSLAVSLSGFLWQLWTFSYLHSDWLSKSPLYLEMKLKDHFIRSEWKLYDLQRAEWATKTQIQESCLRQKTVEWRMTSRRLPLEMYARWRSADFETFSASYGKRTP